MEKPKLFKGHTHRLVLASLLFLLKHSPVWVLPVYIKFIIDLLAAGGSGFNFDTVFLPTLIMAVLILQNIFTHTLFARLLSIVLRDMEANLRIELVEKIQKLPYSFIANNSAAIMQNKILRDVENLSLMTGNIVQNILPAAVTILIALVLTLNSSLLVTLVFALLAPLSILLQRIFWKRLHETNTRFRKDIETMNSKVLEMIEMTPVIKAHALEKVQTENIKAHFNEVKKKGLGLDLIVAWFGSSAWVVFMAAQLLTLIVLGVLVAQKLLSIGDVILFQTYFTSLIGSLNSLMNLLPDLAKGRESYASISEIMLFEDEDFDTSKIVLDELKGRVQFENVSFSHQRSHMILANISLTIEAGTSLALVGESGSGKTTLTQLLVGFHKPKSGKILIDSIDMAELNLHSYRGFVSVVTQETLLTKGTILENIAFGESAPPLERVIDSLKMANAFDFVSLLPDGINTDLGIHGGKLSGGQRQRISIARALYRNPKILILDEATSALDVTSEIEVKKALDSAKKDRTVIIIAHRLSTIEGVDKVAVLKQGKLIEFGPPSELEARNGEFARLSKTR